MKKVIVRIKGGIGNQLFCYAAARRLALINNAELVIDDVTGFVRDWQYQRQYMLDRFSISARKATAIERLEPFERYQRGAMKWLSRTLPFEKRFYIEQENNDFDSRLLALKVKKSIYLDGYWQSEDYFKDVEKIIRQDFDFRQPPIDRENQCIVQQMRERKAVGLHVRWFDEVDNGSQRNVSCEYYKRAIALMESKLGSPHYFLFSDNLKATYDKIDLPKNRTTSISYNKGDENVCHDLWLMTQCRHFIMANSTFSWWGAWLSREKEKIVICPGSRFTNCGVVTWNFDRQIPDNWLPI